MEEQTQLHQYYQNLPSVMLRKACEEIAGYEITGFLSEGIVRKIDYDCCQIVGTFGPTPMGLYLTINSIQKEIARRWYEMQSSASRASSAS